MSFFSSFCASVVVHVGISIFPVLVPLHGDAVELLICRLTRASPPHDDIPIPTSRSSEKESSKVHENSLSAP